MNFCLAYAFLSAKRQAERATVNRFLLVSAEGDL
jgi:hypothetical protein